MSLPNNASGRRPTPARARSAAGGHFKARGTNTGSFMGHPPPGKPMTLDVIDIGRFDNGKLFEH